MAKQEPTFGDGLVQSKPVESPARAGPPVIAAPNPAQPEESTKKVTNLPNHKIPSIAQYVRLVRNQTAVRRATDAQSDEDVEEVRLNAICPIKGCGYPLVNRLEEKLGEGRVAYHIKPTHWEGAFVRVCLFDPDHFREEVKP